MIWLLMDQTLCHIWHLQKTQDQMVSERVGSTKYIKIPSSNMNHRLLTSSCNLLEDLNLYLYTAALFAQ